MYIVEFKKLGKYHFVGEADNYDEAEDLAISAHNYGWINVRIRTPDGKILQVFGEE